LGAEVAVYGAPGTRNPSNLEPEAARALAAQRLQVLGDIAGANGITVGIEPVPPTYGGDFLSVANDVIEFVRELDHPAVRAHLDTGCAALGGDDIGAAIRTGYPWLRHFHAAEPQLAGFSRPRADHSAASAALREVRYPYWVAIEMREQPRDPLGALATAIQFVRATYR